MSRAVIFFLTRAGFVMLAGLMGLSSAQAQLSGGYRGLDEAAGMELRFSGSGAALEGVFVDGSGARRDFAATTLPGGAEATIDRDGRQVYLFFTEEPLGLSMIAIPLDADGSFQSDQTQALAFLKEGVDAPPKPNRYVPPPDGPGGTVDPLAFVESYAFWPSLNVGYGYDMVRGRYRTLIRLHAVVQTDIVWKLCRGSSSQVGLAEALRGQGVNCDEVLSKFETMMRSPNAVETFNGYRRDVEAQKLALVEAIRCSIDYRRSDPECKRAGARVARAATSLETVKTVLDRY
ncbi:MAG: hypothetical protein AAF367_13405 [Pseudomonadota bacterium]